jgi:hypothetical protein
MVIHAVFTLVHDTFTLLRRCRSANHASAKRLFVADWLLDGDSRHLESLRVLLLVSL